MEKVAEWTHTWEQQCNQDNSWFVFVGHRVCGRKHFIGLNIEQHRLLNQTTCPHTLTHKHSSKSSGAANRRLIMTQASTCVHTCLCGRAQAPAEQIKWKFLSELLTVEKKKQNMWGHVEHVEQLGWGLCQHCLRQMPKKRWREH